MRRADPDEPILVRVDIAINQAVSSAIDLINLTPVGLIMSAGWDAANMTALASDALGGTYRNMYDDTGAESTIVSPAAARYIALSNVGPDLAAARFVQLRSGTSGTPVNQTAARTLWLVCRQE